MKLNIGDIVLVQAKIIDIAVDGCEPNVHLQFEDYGRAVWVPTDALYPYEWIDGSDEIPDNTEDIVTMVKTWLDGDKRPLALLKAGMISEEEEEWTDAVWMPARMFLFPNVKERFVEPCLVCGSVCAWDDTPVKDTYPAVWKKIVRCTKCSYRGVELSVHNALVRRMRKVKE